MGTKALLPMAFQFSATKQEVRSLLVESEPWVVAKDICDILGLSDTNMALRSLDEDEKLTQKIFGSGQNRKMWLVNESGLYALIMRSNKPEAKAFRKWVTSEVLPAIRRKGYFGVSKRQTDFIDARDVPYSYGEFQGANVRFLQLNGETWFSVNDIHRALGSSTEASQAAKMLNRKQTLAQKVWLFGNTNPAWFTNETGLHLLMAGSRKAVVNRQLELGFRGGVS